MLLCAIFIHIAFKQTNENALAQMQSCSKACVNLHLRQMLTNCHLGQIHN